MIGPELFLTIEKPVAGGRMLARHDGQVVLVSGAIPGERVRAQVERGPRKVVFATTVEVIEASPHRREPACDPLCGGSAYAFITPDHQRTLKAEVIADAFRRIGRMPLEDIVDVAVSPEHEYRLRGRLHVRHGKAGLYLEGTHRLCDAGGSRQFRNDSLAVVAQVVDQLGPDGADCDSIQLTETVAATSRVVHLEPAEGRHLDVDALATRWRPIDGLAGVTVRSHGRVVRLAGEGRVTDTAVELCGDDASAPDASWTRTAASFFQANRFLAGRLMLRVLAHARGARVVDLYAGVGLFSVGFAARGQAVLAVEGDQISAADLEINASPWSRTLSIRQSSVEAALMTLPPGAFDTVVLDPPRTGTSRGTIAGILGLAPGRVVYVSCDPATLARDAALIRDGGYRLVSIEAFDMFPNTPHIESLAVFDRQAS